MSDTKPNRRERAASFVEALRRIRNDRGKLAALRRGLSDNSRMHVDAWPVVASLGGDIGHPVFVAIAALFATHPEESTDRNLGETCRRIALDEQMTLTPSHERRFRRLLACGEEAELILQLPTWVRLAAAKNIGMNYESLFADLWGWPWDADQIRVRWARSFWQSGENTAPAAAISNPDNA